MRKNRAHGLLLTVAALPLLAGCGVKQRAEAAWQKVPALLDKMPFVRQESKPSGVTYPPTLKAKAVFAPEQVPAGCKVFAHLLIWTPAGANGHGLAGVVEKEAMRWGADLLLLGRSRKAKEDKSMIFVYYGPEEPYNFRERWAGWKFGYSDWVSQGGWAAAGYDEWDKKTVWHSDPLVIQAAFLRCQDIPPHEQP
ncbi:hypothetical protein [Candidatus Electronema sp. JM]|uniref:hypothetical protein n=1 Tax=Candidatus Electronema sp. JM TaxID=3401571 RepID=UPI003AA91837